MVIKMEDARQTWRELMIGITVTAIMIVVIGIWFCENKVIFFLGVLFGAGVSMLLLRHMFRSLDIALDLESGHAQRYIRNKSIQRLIMMGLAVGIAGVLPKYFNVIGVCLGVLTLKFSAYLQPLIHKYIGKKGS